MRLARKKIFFSLFLIIILVILGLFFAVFGREKNNDIPKNTVANTGNLITEPLVVETIKEEPAPAEKSCVSDIRTEEDIVNGTSLSGLIENGAKILVYYGYYDCNGVERGDAVIYDYAGNKEPLIKIVRAIPGDNFELRKSGSEWNIVVNGETLKNSKGLNFNIGEPAYKMLHLYESDYQGIIPANAYLLLGNQVSGTLDSTHFGLVGKDDILGKAVPVKN